MGKIFTLFSILLSALAMSEAALAADKLTEDNIRAFVEETTKITTGQATDMSDEAIKSYLERHLHDDSVFRSKMTYVIPKFPTQQTAMTVKKDEFIDNIIQGKQSLENFEAEVEIVSIKVASNGKTATVKTRSSESGQLPNIQGDQMVNMLGASDCDQIIMLRRNKIQMFQANCTTKVEFLEF